ncbi:MAG: DegT/DnrJ/EryC1/StrS aminotransferase family protein [Acidobacteria bacterium]|nr:DegT/DnrJ/EryC1/StrS aminotransferase family protein [Acidobacteriota bacterium]
MRNQFLAYSLPQIGEEEINEVVDSLRSGWVTTGPKVKRFEAEFAHYAGARNAIAVNSCTAALHLSLKACGIGPGDEVIVPTMTFCATANVVEHLGAKPVIADVGSEGLLDAEAVYPLLTARTRAIIPVHFAGQACEMHDLLELAHCRGVQVLEDAAHAVGAAYHGTPIGTLGRTTSFSFYATKNMTTGEGGMITTEDDQLAVLLRRLALHGMSRDAWKRYTETGSWYYEVMEPGYKDNMTDIQASMGLHQLRKLDGFIQRRRGIAARFDAAFRRYEELQLPEELPGRRHVYHVYAVRIREGRLRIDRTGFIDELRKRNIGTSVHFIPLHRHPYYRDTYGYRPEQFPNAEHFFKGLFSLPAYPRMTDEDVEDVIAAVTGVIENHRASTTVRVGLDVAAGVDLRPNAERVLPS